MPTEAIWLILFIVAMLVGPFATLRALAHLRSRKRHKQNEPPPDNADDDPDKPSGDW